MNKYSLTFLNSFIEKEYQKNCIGGVRMNMFKLIIVSQIVVYVVRVGQAALEKNKINTISSAIMIVFLIFLYLLAKKYQFLLRTSIILVNHVFTIYLLLIDDSNDPYSAYLRGVNQMGSNLLIMLSGEYVDAIFSLFSIQIIRIIIVFNRSQNIEYYAIFAVFVISSYASKQLHMYHKALRSQFLLTLREKSWQNIFDQVIKEIPYLLLTFDEEELKFSISAIKNCNKLMANNEQALQFLRNSTHNGKTLEQFIFKEIENYKKNHEDFFNNKVCVYKEKCQYLLEYSIFFGNQPTILIIFKDLKQIQCQQTLDSNHQKQQLEFYHFCLKFFQKLLVVEDKRLFLKQIQKKFLILKLIEEIQLSSFVVKRISLNKLFLQIKKLYPYVKISFLIDQDIQIKSIPSLINLFLISAFETLESNNIGIYQRAQLNQYLEFHMTGSFNSQFLKQIHSRYKSKFNLIVTNLKITKNSIFLVYLVLSFKLFSQAYVPFNF